NDVYSSADQLISQEAPYLFVSNFGDTPVKIQQGDILAKAHTPNTWLDHTESFTDSDRCQIQAYNALVTSLVEQKSRKIKSETTLTSKAHQNAEGPDDILASPPVEGGPKTALESEETVPSLSLLQEVDICPDLTIEQKNQLAEVIVKNKEAFGLDGRLGNYDGLVHIPLKPGTKPISLPPFGASPANRKVI
ncbi:hypothetical protein FISHEDRAFT_6670, partial [Fistulina hepatica ATCC 64428]